MTDAPMTDEDLKVIEALAHEFHCDYCATNLELQKTCREIRTLWQQIVDLEESGQQEFDRLREDSERLESEQKVLAFAIKRYPEMWLSTYPRLKESVEKRMKEAEVEGD